MGYLPLWLFLVLGFILLVVVVFLIVLPIWFMIFSAKRLQEISQTCTQIRNTLIKQNKTETTEKVDTKQE